MGFLFGHSKQNGHRGIKPDPKHFSRGGWGGCAACSKLFSFFFFGSFLFFSSFFLFLFFFCFLLLLRLLPLLEDLKTSSCPLIPFFVLVFVFVGADATCLLFVCACASRAVCMCVRYYIAYYALYLADDLPTFVLFFVVQVPLFSFFSFAR